MERRLLMILGAFAVVIVAVGSAAATMSQGKPLKGESVQPAADAQGVKAEKKAVTRTAERKTNELVTTSPGSSQSTKEVESYWTKERMEDAQPMERTRPAGTTNAGSSSSSSAPSGTTSSGSTPTKKSTPQKSSTKKSQSADDTGLATSPAQTPNPGYWTDEAMAGAQPMERTQPSGSGSQGSADQGGSTAPGSPPP